MADQSKILFRIVLVLLFLVASLDFLLIFQKSEIQDAENLNTRKASDYVTKSFFSRLIKLSQPSNSNVLIVGDSYAQDFMNALLSERFFNEDNIDTIHISAACGINFSPSEFIEFIPSIHRQNCIAKGGLSRFEHLFDNYELLIIAGKWEGWHIDGLEEVIRRLQLSGVKKVVIVGSKYLKKPDLRLLSGRGRESPVSSKNDNLQIKPEDAEEIEKRLKELAEKIEDTYYINIANYFEASQLSNENIYTTPLTFDGYHLTKAGAKYLGLKIKSEHVSICSGFGQALNQCGENR